MTNKIHSCSNCELKFENPGALSMHITWKHSIVPIAKTTANSTIFSKVTDINGSSFLLEQQPIPLSISNNLR